MAEPVRRRVSASFAALLVGSFLLASPAPALAAEQDPRLEIESLLATQVAAWNRGDLEAFVAAYADDVAFASPSGFTNGRQQVLERYRNRYPDHAAMGTLAIEVLEVRLPPCTGEAGPTAASLLGRWSLAYPDKPEASGATLIVFHRGAQGWRIVQDASM